MSDAEINVTRAITKLMVNMMNTILSEIYCKQS